MVSIGDRLREERESLGWSQETMAAAAGITKKTLGLYERNERSPSAEYLAAWSAHGVDVLYVLTGQRTPSTGRDLSARETAVLQNYRALPEEDQAAVQRLTNALAESSARHAVDTKKTG